VLELLGRTHGLPNVSAHSGQTAGFRLRARLAIRGRLSSPKLGLFELGTHRVVHIPHCSVQHPLINRVAEIVRRALVETKVTSYSDKAHLGIARYLQVAVERSSQSAQVVIVANSPTPQPLSACFELIRERLGSELHSLWFNANLERSNSILGPTFEHVCGPAGMVERFGAAAVHYPPGAFGQSNLEIAQRIIEHVRGEVPEGARVTEFYAGVGAIGLSILDRVSEIRMNEASPQSLAGLEAGIAELDAQSRAKVTVVPGFAGAQYLAASGAQVVIADPPRKGLDPALSQYLSENPPERFFYVSCGLESFLADVQRLTSPGKLRLRALGAFNLLPFTEHVETVARFERA
jgi:tRNA/tmRNA/rRNA uracil-C5-methylase (TrmA/RlmC/RlmD family)